jgi:tRNA pseudouridine55 synthase
LRKTRGANVDGVLLLDKPRGITSNAALQKARRLLDARKAGHTGTLDPLASGLLPVAFGEATKFAADLIDADKAYDATLKLGVRTSTGDAEGEVLATQPVAVTPAQIEAVLSRLTGTIAQVPPMHSALKRDGRPLYELARAGMEVERAPRQVTIYALRLLGAAGDEIRVAVECSKGTYVRVLAEDIGNLLGCGAHLTALRRTRAGRLTLEGSITLEALQALAPAQRVERLLSLDTLLQELPRLQLDAAAAERFRLGQRLACSAEPRGARVRVYGPAEKLLGVATISEYGVVAPERLIAMALEQQ